MTDIFHDRRQSSKGTCVPVWFMRQAGRYHSHYQAIKKNSDFMTMCTNPQLARDVTMGPIEDFKFDAAILFSDLLFPLQHLGMGLRYEPGPKLDWHLNTPGSQKKLKEIAPAKDFYAFQGKACELLKKSLPAEKTLIGFVGAPFTLYTYAVEGGHAGNLVEAKKGLFDGRWKDFNEVLFPGLMEEMAIQAQGGADAIALFDTAAGELSSDDYAEHVVPAIKKIINTFKEKFPQKKVIYYSKMTQAKHWAALEGVAFDVLGVDWRCDMIEVQKMYPTKFVQGNFDPAWLHLPQELLLQKVRRWHKDLIQRGLDSSRWIAGLGHGVLIETPEDNVRQVVKLIREDFVY